jgi:hypothetical protein
VIRPSKTALTRVLGLLVVTVPAMLLLAPPALAAGESKPAGGAETAEVVIATAGAMAATAALFWLGMAHRSGKTDILRRLGQRAESISGLPAWAALPTDLATVSLMTALFGMYWDISLHIDAGRDSGPLANPAHYFILFGLFGIFAAGFLATVLPERKPGRYAVKLGRDWYAPVGGLLMLATASFALAGFPLDDMWHRLFGQDVTLWGPTHLMLIGGAGLTLLGHAALFAEGKRAMADTGQAPAPPPDRLTALLRFAHRVRYAGVFGGLLIGLSTFQGEFDFGVPQFQLIFHPMLIAVAAGIALVGARIYAGPGGALGAAVFFIVIRGGVALLVGPALGEVTPHLPLYLAEAAVVELVALALATDRPYRFGAIAGVLVGLVGLAAEWGWSHVWMPHPWPSSMLGEALVVTPLAGLAGGLIGAFVGVAIGAPMRRTQPAAIRLAPAAAALVVITLLVGYGLRTDTPEGVRAAVTLTEVPSSDGRQAHATVRLEPRQAADDAKWLTALAWQGGKGTRLHLDHLERTGPGTYRTTEPVPIDGSWKSEIRLQTGNSLLAAPVYLPADPAIPVGGVPAKPSFDRAFVSDHELLQREKKDDVPGYLAPLGYGVVGLIVLTLIGALGWALARLAGVDLTLRRRRRARPPVGRVRTAGN